jgi:phosphoribosylamine---glycine ligase
VTVPARVLVVGSGAREHALAWRLAQDAGVEAVHVAPGNAGMADVATVHSDVGAADFGALAALGRRLAVDLVVVGPEGPLALGLADALAGSGLVVFGPFRAAAALESSKSFCRSVAEAVGIPMADGASFDEPEAAIRFARALGAPVVVKADGLARGKGVRVCPTLAGAEVAIRDALERGVYGTAGARVVVERQLIGREASLMAVCDGRRALALPPARDYKRLGDGDGGPNTGGMGAYSPLPDLADDDADPLLDLFQRPALAEMERRGKPFRGVLYAGLMLTEDGPRLLEFNVRLGDPEAQVILPRMGGSLAPLLADAARGDVTASPGPAVRPDAAVGVVLASAGYPDQARAGDPIDGVDGAQASGALVFHAGTALRDGRLITDGGRVLTVVAQAPDRRSARDRAYAATGQIRFAGMQMRTDIAAPARELAEALA